MSALLLLIVCLLLGLLVKRYAAPPAGMVPALNWWVLYVALPALVLELVPQVHVNAQLWFPVVAMWLVFFGAWLLFALLGRWLGWSRGRIGTLVLVCGLGNTSFMGYPILLALRGQPGLSLAVVADQLGTFPMLASIGVVVASLYAGRRPQVAVIARRIVTFPAFLALLLGAWVGALGGWPQAVHDLLAPLGATLTPLALFSVGMQWRFGLNPGQGTPLLLGLGWKLLLAPLLCFVLARLTAIHGLPLVAGVLQAAMAPMISAAILADEYELEPPLANALLGAGIVLSLGTVLLANALLGAG